MIIGILGIILGIGIIAVSYIGIDVEQPTNPEALMKNEDLQILLIAIGVFFIIFGILAIIVKQMQTNAKRTEKHMEFVKIGRQEDGANPHDLNNIIDKKYCTFCGNSLSANVQFCGKCGAKVKES